MAILRMLPAVVLAAACANLDLDLGSEGTSVTATARGDGTTEVAICGGPHEFLSCSDADRFSVSMGAQVVEDDDIATQLFGGRLAYLDDDRAGATIVVRRVRDGAEMSVELPAAFSLTAPAAGAVVSRAAGVTLRWTGHSDDVTWSVKGSCGDLLVGNLGDVHRGDDSVTLRGDALPGSGSCELDLAIAHRRTGHVGRGFPDESGIVGVQERSVHVRLVP